MKISVVTPSYNQAQFIEETIQSVLAQNYEPFEHIVIDGGSTDGTIEILRRYPHLKWVSEPDRGQSHALNKGLAMVTGDIIGWLNSDDLYEPAAFQTVAECFEGQPDLGMIYGYCRFIDQRKRTIRLVKPPDWDLHRLIAVQHSYIPGPTVFFRREVYRELGGLDEDLHYAMDYEYWIRIGREGRVHRIPEVLAAFRHHPEGKTARWKEMRAEAVTVALSFDSSPVVIKHLRRAYWGGRNVFHRVRLQLQSLAATARHFSSNE